MQRIEPSWPCHQIAATALDGFGQKRDNTDADLVPAESKDNHASRLNNGEYATEAVEGDLDRQDPRHHVCARYSTVKLKVEAND